MPQKGVEQTVQVSIINTQILAFICAVCDVCHIRIVLWHSTMHPSLGHGSNPCALSAKEEVLLTTTMREKAHW